MTHISGQTNANIALLVFCAATITAAATYRHIRDREGAPATLISTIPTGPQSYQIYSDGKPVGTIISEVTTASDKSAALLVEKRLQTTYADYVGQILLSGHATFDKEGRLDQSLFEIRIHRTRILTQTKNNGSIQIRADRAHTYKSVKLELSSPGTIKVVHNPNKFLGCAYTPLLPLFVDLLASLASHFHLSERPICSSETTSTQIIQTLDLCPFTKLINLSEAQSQKGARLL